MNSHTPAPWSFDGRGEVLSAATCVAVVQGRTLDGAPVKLNEYLANASLIASAPELLSVCQAIAKDLESLADGGLEDTWDDELFKLWLSGLRSAIAKAEGRANETIKH